MDYWKKQNIDSFIIEFEKYYLDCSANSIVGQSICNKINTEETNYLNNNLNLSKITGIDTNYILNETLRQKDKNKFSYFLINTPSIKLEINKIDKTGKTVFMLLAENYFSEKNDVSIYLFIPLFERGYLIKKEDEDLIASLYKKIESQRQFINWSLLRFAVLLKDSEKFHLALNNQKELFVILSLKLNKPIGFNFPNLLGVINNALQFYRENGDVILKAMHYYNRYQQIIDLDERKGTFKNKLMEYEANKPIQNIEFKKLVLILFTELN